MRFLLIGLLALSVATGALAAEQEIATIRRGWDFAGLPLLNFTSDRGVGYGAYVASFYHGSEGAGDYPYKASIGGQFYQTTEGYAYHKLLLDFPNIQNTGIRVDVAAGYETWDRAWYFGQGNDLPRWKSEQVAPRYYESNLQSIWLVPNLRVPLGKSWSVFGGFVLRSTTVEAYAQSLLAEEAPEGVDGGFLSLAQVGVMLDTRDREPLTRDGIFSELSVRGATNLVGSDFSYWGANATHRQWLPLLDRGRLVLALRFGLDIHRGDVPFFQQPILGGSQWVHLGGNLTLRGLPVGRYRGEMTAYSNMELRWRFWDFSLFRSDFQMLWVPFIDVGRVWSWDDDSDQDALVHGSMGAGFRVAYNDVFVVRFDVACGLERFRVGADGTDSQHRPVVGFYGIVNHPF